MKFNRILVVSIAIFLFSGCSLNKIPELEKENETLKSQIEEYEGQIDDLKDEVNNLQAENEKQKELLDDYSKEIEEVTTAFSSLQNQNKALKESLDQMQSDIGEESSTVGNTLGATLIFNPHTVKVGDQVGEFTVEAIHHGVYAKEDILFNGTFQLTADLIIDEENYTVYLKVDNEEYVNILPISTTEIALYEENQFKSKYLAISNLDEIDQEIIQEITTKIITGNTVSVTAKFNQYNYLYSPETDVISYVQFEEIISLSE